MIAKLLRKNLPIVVPGWEDSTMGNIFASYCIKGDLKASTMKSGIEYMMFLADWYPKTAVEKELVSSKLVEELQVISNLCCTNVISGYGNARHSVLELFLSDFRFYHFLWFIFWSSSERKNYLGKIRYHHTEIHR